MAIRIDMHTQMGGNNGVNPLHFFYPTDLQHLAVHGIYRQSEQTNNRARYIPTPGLEACTNSKPGLIL